MLLNESQVKFVNEAQEKFEHKPMDAGALQEWFEMDNAPDIYEDDIDVALKIAQLQEKYLNETNVTANIANFTPKIQPLLRRIVPKLMAFDLAGVQPIAMPTSDIFMIKAQYSGTTANPASSTTAVIIESTQGSVAQPIAVGDTITSENGNVGTVVYTNAAYTKIIANVTTGTFIAGEKFDVGASYVAGTNDITITGVYSNEAGFKKILPEYSGPYTTAQGEVLGASMRQLRVTIVKQGITAKTRKLKAELTLELIKDMSAIHGASADKEIMYFLELEIVNDLNTEIIEKYKEISTLEANFAIVTTTNTQGRWAQEMYSGLWDRILKDKRNLSTRNQRGQGNHMVATSGVISALESLGKFMDMNVRNNVIPGTNHSQNYVGTLIDGTKVYQDWFATEEYYMLIYKGQGNFDAGLIYSPYTMMEFLEAKDPLTFQPILGIMQRYALTQNTLLDSSTTASDYCTYRTIDFTSTPLKD